MTAPNMLISAIARNLHLPVQQVSETMTLLEAGGTVPFIARYRKEATGSLDEVGIDAIRVEHKRLQEIEKRRDSIIETLIKNDRLTDTLHSKLKAADSLTVLEDIYLPHKQKRKTRALKAIEKGLQPLAELLLNGRGNKQDISRFIDSKRSVGDREEALAGARDIIAEKISE